MVAIETELIPNIKADEHTTRQSDGQAKQIDEAETFVFQQIAERYFKIIFKHGSGWLKSKQRSNLKQAPLVLSSMGMPSSQLFVFQYFKGKTYVYINKKVFMDGRKVFGNRWNERQ